MNFLPSNSFSGNLSQFVNFDVSDQDLRLLLQQIYFALAYQINEKDVGSYETIEQLNGQQYFDPANAQRKRYVFRIVVNFGALPNTATKSVAHGITVDANTNFTRIYATASDTTALTYIPIPYVDPTTLANGIELDVDATNVNITTAANYSAYNVCYVVLEYVKG